MYLLHSSSKPQRFQNYYSIVLQLNLSLREFVMKEEKGVI